MSVDQGKPNFDEGIPTLDETLAKIKNQAERVAQAHEGSTEATAAAAAVSGQSADASVPNVSAPVSTEAVQEGAQGGAESASPAAEGVSKFLRKKLALEAEILDLERRKQEATATPSSQAAEPSLAQLRTLYKRNKIEALKALDPNFKPGVTAKELWYHDLGDLAPKEAKTELAAMSAAGSVEALQAELEETKQEVLRQIQQHRMELMHQQYVGSLQSYTTSLPESLPLVKKFTAKKPEKVVEALLGVARKHAQNTGGQLLTPQQAAAKLEASLRDLQLNDPSPATTTVTTDEKSGAVTAPNTLRNKHTAVQPGKTGIDDDLNDEKLREKFAANLERMKRQAAKFAE